MHRDRLTVWLVLALCVWGAASARAQTPAPTIEYYHLDALRSVRVVTDYAGVEIRRHELLPFGEEWTEDGTPGPDEARLFTGKERDTETGLDYFGARYYRAEIGRFTTIDPVLDQQAALTDPQRWNRYAYARNNPLRFIDPDGKDIVQIVLPHTGNKPRLDFVDTRVVDNLKGFLAEARDKKISFTFNEVFRTPEMQDRIVTTNTKNTRGTSPHTVGLAFDINVTSSLNGTDLAGLTQLAGKYGFQPLANQAGDPPHFQANAFITRGPDGKVDQRYLAMQAVNQRQAWFFTHLNNMTLSPQPKIVQPTPIQ